MIDHEIFKKYISEMFLISAKLTELTGRPFTPDGHMVGSIGEEYAELSYGIKLYPPSYIGHDGTWNGKKVQIKTTQRNTSVYLKGIMNLLLVLQIKPDGSFIEIYNGDGKRPWNSISHKKETRDGKSITLNMLRELNKQVRPSDKIPGSPNIKVNPRT
jgi:hypothetical protein